jgi:hypothetical protein
MLRVHPKLIQLFHNGPLVVGIFVCTGWTSVSISKFQGFGP